MTVVADTRDLRFEVGTTTGSVSAILVRPEGARGLYVLAHGAGAGMRHRFMEDVAQGLAGVGVATLRYQFPYIEAGRKAPDIPNRLVATVRAAVRTAAEECPDLPLVAGGKSLGGRMTSTAASREDLPGVRGLIFLGFPLHAPSKPGDERAAHLSDVTVPMLFVQGTRDALAKMDLIKPVVEKLDATIHIVDGGDHSFNVPKRTGRTKEEVMAGIVQAIGVWLTEAGAG